MNNYIHPVKHQRFSLISIPFYLMAMLLAYIVFGIIYVISYLYIK